MSEESDHPSDPNILVVHSFPWWSQSKTDHLNFCYEQLCIGLNDFLARLDLRYEKKIKKDSVTMTKKSKKLGLSSQSPPPVSVPAWTIDQEWKVLHVYCFYSF